MLRSLWALFSNLLTFPLAVLFLFLERFFLFVLHVLSLALAVLIAFLCLLLCLESIAVTILVLSQSHRCDGNAWNQESGR